MSTSTRGDSADSPASHPTAIARQEATDGLASSETIEPAAEVNALRRLSTRWRMFWRSFGCVVRIVGTAALISAPVSSSFGQDVVRIAPEDGTGRPFGIEGEVLEYTGREIVVRTSGGSERRFPAERVVEIETAWPASYDAGVRAAAEGENAQAEEQLLAAVRAEPRAWARREILSHLVVALLRQEKLERAGEVGLAILASDPTSPHFVHLPLAWTRDEAVAEQAATQWLEKEQPAARLLGASHLVHSSRQRRALQELQALTASDDLRIAALAEAQLWRTRLPGVDSGDIEQWRAGIERMPSRLRPGPYFVLGQALRRLGQYDEAALALLRVPIHVRNRPELAARALVEAAQAVHEAGHTLEAERLADEVVAEYANTASAEDARDLINELRNAP